MPLPPGGVGAGGRAAVQDAARLDPESADAQRALAEANAAALRKAEELLAADDGKQAFDLTSLVLKASPNDPRARSTDGRVRDRLAEQAYGRAEAFLQKNKRGNALMELAACVGYRPAYKDAKLRIGELKLELTKELMFTVVLDRFAAGAGSPDLANALSPELLARSFDERLPLRVVREAPPEKEAARGVRVSGKFDAYKFVHDQTKVGRTCDYVCGKDTKPNPEYANVEQQVASAERRQATAEEDVARIQKDVDRYQKEVDGLMKDVDRAQQDADKARADLDRCRQQAKPGDSSACSSEDSRFRSEQSDLENQRRRISSPQSNLSSARDRLASANESRNSARRDRERETERMRTTPRTIEVDRMCAHNYSVDVHTLAARVTVELSAEALADKTKILDKEPFEYKVARKDEAFEAQQGRCAAVASGDPLTLPSEKDVKQELVTQAIGGVREKVMGTYDRYRQRFLADARREEAAGLSEEAVEAYVRYLLTGLKGIDPKDEKQIGAFLAKTRGFGKIDLLGGL